MFQKIYRGFRCEDVSWWHSRENIRVEIIFETKNQEDTPEVPQEVKLSSNDNVMTSSATSASVSEQRDREIEQVRSMVASLKERNIRLTRLNMALSIELKDIISERVLLEGK